MLLNLMGFEPINILHSLAQKVFIYFFKDLILMCANWRL